MPSNSNNRHITFVECPRDAMQGWSYPISTDLKVQYLRTLLAVGFPVLDFGSFVSARAIPQMADTADVLQRLDYKNLDTSTKLLSIVANLRGAQTAVQYDEIHYLGFPFSISETFQLRNTNSTIEQSLERVRQIQQCCQDHGKELVIYLSMGFGNPYGDPYNTGILQKWADQMAEIGITTLSLADTVGLATAEEVHVSLSALIQQYPSISIGAHLHSTKANTQVKLAAALEAGCRRFDGALKGIGGCPMAQNELVGNMDTELMLHYFKGHSYYTPIDETALQQASLMAGEVFLQ